MMAECKVCHEWYHGRCLKIARGEIKEDDKYTCPICDYRVKIPRDSARPKLEDLINWQLDIPGLPFIPDEMNYLNNIIQAAKQFREYLRPYTSSALGLTSTEVPTMRFYLQKIEGAEILLAHEINFFRTKLHRWMPIASELPPSTTEVSVSTLTAMANLASTCRNQGRWKEAQELELQVMEARMKVLGNEHPDTLTAMASTYRNQGRLYEKVLVPDNTSTLDTVSNLENLYYDQGELAEAEAMYRRALAGYEKALGPDHPSTLDTASNLGLLYSDQGKLAEAEGMYRRALAGKKR